MGRSVLIVYTMWGSRMEKKQYVLSGRDKPAAKSTRRISDCEMNSRDILKSTDEKLRGARRVGRPKSANAKQLIAIRIDPRLLARLRKLAHHSQKPYQTLIHELLQEAADRRINRI
ncbi:MAG: BrnA antitoxin family protein [Candidatus Acidiferrales bacterium]